MTEHSAASTPLQTSEGHKKSVAALKQRHRNTLVRAIANVLSSEIAASTYAQIVDGLPLRDTALDVYRGCVCPRHPLLDEHDQLCPGVLEHTRALCRNFDANALEFDSQVGTLSTPQVMWLMLIFSNKLIHDYQSASPTSSAFTTRLIELVTRAVHQVAVWLYKQDTNRHKKDALGVWRPQKEDVRHFPPTFPSTLFCHEWYRDYDQYPEGMADCVGYWAEARIFGGVVLFDRRERESAPDADVSRLYPFAIPS